MWRHDLTAKRAFIDTDNINALIGEAGFRGELGLLSIDIDGNDYWVWKAITVVSPTIVVCEYNAVFGDMHELVVPYRRDFARNVAHYSNQYFGASIRALVALAKSMGFTFVGTTSTGCNAFFVRNDFAPAILSALDGTWAFPSAVREGRKPDGSLSLASGSQRMEVIRELPLLDLRKNETTKISALPELYSREWLREQNAGFENRVRSAGLSAPGIRGNLALPLLRGGGVSDDARRGGRGVCSSSL